MWRSQMSPALRLPAFRDLAGLGDGYAVSELICSVGHYDRESTEGLCRFQELSHSLFVHGASSSIELRFLELHHEVTCDCSD